jgi:transposase
MKVHVGVDLHKQTSQIAVLTEDGELKEHRLVNDVEQVEKFFAQLPAKTPVAIEASGTWWWLVDLLERLGHQPVLSNPKQTKAIAAARLKNDRVDARRLALLLRGDLLPTVWIPPTEVREARELVRHRVQLVWVRRAIRNRVIAMLARRNLQPTSGKSWFTTRGQREFERVPLSTFPSRIRQDYRALLPVLDAQIRQLDLEILQRWGADPRVQRLATLPGIGPFTAIVLVLELGDLSRFAHAKQVASYVGLTPRVRASADRLRSGHISKEGNRLLRWALVLAATQAARRPGPLRTWFHAVQQRRGKKIARVALARRLVEIVYHVWKQECDFFTVVRHGVVRG